MPRYIARNKTWIGHECRMVNEGDEFETEFPKVKLPDGSEKEMELGDNLALVEPEKAARKGKAPQSEDLV
jgi:hypothetical protein